MTEPEKRSAQSNRMRQTTRMMRVQRREAATDRTSGRKSDQADRAVLAPLLDEESTARDRDDGDGSNDEGDVSGRHRGRRGAEAVLDADVDPVLPRQQRSIAQERTRTRMCAATLAITKSSVEGELARPAAEPSRPNDQANCER